MSAREHRRPTPPSCTPGSTRARRSLESALVRRGHELLTTYAGRSGIALEKTGAVLVAWDAEQAARLDDVVAKAQANGYQRARRITLEELYGREPNLGAGATGAVVIPDESIICPWTTSIAYATEAVGAGVELRLGVEVTAVTRDADAWLLRTTRGALRSDWVVNAVGPRMRPAQPAVRPRRVHDRAAAGPAHRVRQVCPPAAVVDPAAGAHRADEGSSGGTHGLRQRAVGPHGRGRADRRDTTTTAAGIDGPARTRAAAFCPTWSTKR